MLLRLLLWESFQTKGANYQHLTASAYVAYAYAYALYSEASLNIATFEASDI